MPFLFEMINKKKQEYILVSYDKEVNRKWPHKHLSTLMAVCEGK